MQSVVCPMPAWCMLCGGIIHHTLCLTFYDPLFHDDNDDDSDKEGDENNR